MFTFIKFVYYSDLFRTPQLQDYSARDIAKILIYGFINIGGA